MKLQKFALCALASLPLTACAHNAANTHPPSPATLADAINEIGRRSIDQDGIVGVSIAVAKDGEIIFAQGFGYADVARTVPATQDTIYDIASAGKQFTAAAILSLADQNRLTLDQHAREFIPELPDNFPDPTIEELLRQTSGFVSGNLDELNPPDDYNTKRYGLELLTDIELQTGAALFKPQETWVYSNAGYLVLGIIVEAASGMRYDEYVRSALLVPNGLTDITVCERAQPPRMSDAIRRSDTGIATVPLIDMTAYSGQGSICSSVVDLLRWSHALNTGRIITPDSLKAMRSASTVRGEHATAEIPYGMAQRIGLLGPYSKVGHTGTFDGGSAALAFYPEAGLEIAVLSNTRGNDTPHAYTIETEIAKRILAVAPIDVEAARQPLTSDVKAQIEGAYSNGNHFQATFEEDDLVVIRDGVEIERLVHIGDRHFRQIDNPDTDEWFILDGDHAGWWVYNVAGNFLEVTRRVPEP